MTDILNLTYEELEAFMTAELGEPRFRARQVWQWLWQKCARSFDEMTNVSKATRARLAEKAVITWPEVETVQKSADGTTKFLLRLADGALVETVLIPSASREGTLRITQCLSCQVGCAMGCTFCSTGTMGFERNMTMGEILGQVLVARAHLGDSRPDHPILRNLVFMGMGEPLLNLNEVMRSLRTLNDEFGLSFSPRRITVSTCGIEKGLRELGESGLAFLAVSLHAPNQEIRKRIMPKAAHWHLDDLITALESYPLKTRERVTFEYLLLGGVNDGIEHARELVRLVSRTKGKLNLIVYNPAEGDPYDAPTPERILAFEQYLWSKNITAIIRKSKGQDIKAACGQLKASELQRGTASAGADAPED
ncbi:23S rRNA (adenine(2503)-C(2))-methyltransferase RlmN [Nitratidesulfovibrio vulgaris]|jgi:23S rRNA (adenine2503-C2)-methyltransferase|uniref:Dual-specificity RNA methyltransferase RlmN n=1 Tax=Nitratidesulfovibrio vulgaris (strain DP4) TaxID=391774 RepID=RLMN_NITV4|nr:23S rRNA (adenine(2503)-C(2))-methyltransferase RlmN [Nitratidesulfovibrio vulgaris]A1VAL8.1 RecName: Full=Dual-specificity RNA methyltransferase RlmN; AltName: Full=23S rRNA (adenine(2503)-C(2))-methyltransferase; AltName: Full=23S rRNA m2A2503 methyltransferase; AltName: Full=Ribosomal RNA large subunit methyltransferase N; AltName: Full=tRNA (adenine(37)-C(2))-methyltransferase; AltName: Full=tRNA m2A37 methyltransferase [Nitratidesulfovibrio vulgaris DP4]ABM27484.1 23S rRNA m(2)A-2503 meth